MKNAGGIRTAMLGEETQGGGVDGCRREMGTQEEGR